MTFAYYLREGDFTATFPPGKEEELIVFGYSAQYPHIHVDRAKNPMTGTINPLNAKQKSGLHAAAAAQRALLPAHKPNLKIGTRGTTPQTWAIFDPITGLMLDVRKLPAGWSVQKGKPILW